MRIEARGEIRRAGRKSISRVSWTEVMSAADAQRLSRACLGMELTAPEGPVRLDPETRHLWLTPRIGVMRANGLFEIEWEANGPQRPDPYLTASSFQESWLR